MREAEGRTRRDISLGQLHCWGWTGLFLSLEHLQPWLLLPKALVLCFFLSNPILLLSTGLAGCSGCSLVLPMSGEGQAAGAGSILSCTRRRRAETHRAPHGELVGTKALCRPPGKGDRAGAIASTTSGFPGAGPWPALGEKGVCPQHKAGLSWQRGTNKSARKVHEHLTFSSGKRKKKKRTRGQEGDFLEASRLPERSLQRSPPPPSLPCPQLRGWGTNLKPPPAAAIEAPPRDIKEQPTSSGKVVMA